MAPSIQTLRRRRNPRPTSSHKNLGKTSALLLAVLALLLDSMPPQSSSSIWMPQGVAAFGWIKRTPSLSERLMGMRPELNRDSSSSTTGMQQQQHIRTARTHLYAKSGSNKATTSSTKKDQADMIDFINQESSAQSRLSDEDADPLAPLDVETMDMVYTICRAADARKASDIVALKVHHISTLTSVLVVLSGNSRPQNQAIAASIVDDVRDQYDGRLPGGNGIPEGSADSGWMVLDYGAVMVHIMTPKSRLFYNVQGQWEQKGGRPLPIDHILVPNYGAGAGLPNNGTNGGPVMEPDEEDPFWS